MTDVTWFTCGKPESPEFSPDEATLRALEMAAEALGRLKRAGWTDASTPAPRDRDFLSVQAGSTGVFRTRWMGSAFFAEDGGDLWPGAFIAWRDLPVVP